MRKIQTTIWSESVRETVILEIGNGSETTGSRTTGQLFRSWQRGTSFTGLLSCVLGNEISQTRAILKPISPNNKKKKKKEKILHSAHIFKAAGPPLKTAAAATAAAAG